MLPSGAAHMSLDVLALVVAAAFAHASWNLISKPAVGGAAFVWLYAAAGTVLYLPVLVVALVADPGPLGWKAVGLMAGSGLLHALYFVLLQRAYGAGDLSVVYPWPAGPGRCCRRRRRSGSWASDRARSRSRVRC